MTRKLRVLLYLGEVGVGKSSVSAVDFRPTRPVMEASEFSRLSQAEQTGQELHAILCEDESEEEEP